MLSDGSYGIIKSIKVEKFPEPETTYNFEVEDFHTYFVGESEVLVHNACLKVNDNGFNEWLNKGESNNIVYKCVNKEGQEVYTGITKQELSARLAQHIRSGKEFDRLVKVASGLTRNQARAIETYKIITDGTSHLNKILSISRKHKYFTQAMQWVAMVGGG